MKEVIDNYLKDKEYTGLILKLIARKIDDNWVNYFTSLTLANDAILKINDVDWTIQSGNHFPAQTAEQSKVVEFINDSDDILLIRKHLKVDDLYDIVSSCKDDGQLAIDGKYNIKYNIFFNKNESYTVGSRTESIFNSANIHLDRMAEVLVGWSKSDSITTLAQVSRCEINGLSFSDPITNLLGFYEPHIPKELCDSLCIYFPNYRAWLAAEKFDSKKGQVQVAVCTETKEYLRELVILYKINKSKESLLFNSFLFSDTELPKIGNDENLVFYQPIDVDIDTTSLILLNRNFEILDYSTDAYYVKSIACTFDLVGLGRKSRSHFDITRPEFDIEILSKRKELVAHSKHEQILFSSGNQFLAINRVKAILDKAREHIIIADPYFGNDNSDWDIFNEIASNINVLILTCIQNRRRGQVGNFQNCLALLKTEITNTEAKDIFYSIPGGRVACPFHDRYFIIDNSQVWAIGSSINGLGKRDSSIININASSNEEIITRLNYYILDPNPIQKVLRGTTWTDLCITVNDI